MHHCIFRFATRGQCIKGKKLDCFEHKFCFKLQCASIVVLLCTAIWWKSKHAVVHFFSKKNYFSATSNIQVQVPTEHCVKFFNGLSPTSFSYFRSYSIKQSIKPILEQIYVKNVQTVSSDSNLRSQM